MAIALLAASRTSAANAEDHFKVLRTIEQRIGVDSPAVYVDRGVRLEALPIFVRGAATTSEAISGFHVSISYRDSKSGESETWLRHEFVGNRAGAEERFGPFINHDGTGFIVELHVHSTPIEARLEFQLASDGIVEKKPSSAAEDSPGFTLLYSLKPIPGVKAAKQVYSVYSNVTMALDLVKLANAAVAPEEFVVSLVVGQVIDRVVALVPEDYEGLIAYRCRRCGHRGRLADFSGCITLECEHCRKNRAEICFRSIDLDFAFTG